MPSSEMIAAVTGALGIDLGRLLYGIAGNLGRPSPAARPAGPVFRAA